MTKFLDGPAAGIVLALRRSPTFLRVVRARYARESEQEWDALDQPSDAPRMGEDVHVYRCVSRSGVVCVRARKGGGCFALAEYRYHEAQPDRETGRDTAKWREWATAEAARLKGEAQP